MITAALEIQRAFTDKMNELKAEKEYCQSRIGYIDEEILHVGGQLTPIDAFLLENAHLIPKPEPEPEETEPEPGTEPGAESEEQDPRLEQE